MNNDTREREITRKALVLCLSHPLDCDCRGCRDIYALLQPGEKEQAMSDLEPCPFCGGKARIHAHADRGGTGFTVECLSGGCQATGPWREDRHEAIAAWNLRVEPAPDQDQEADEPKCTCHDAEWIYGVDPGEGYGEYRGWWCAICHGEDMPPMFYPGGKPGPEWHVDINCPIHGNSRPKDRRITAIEKRLAALEAKMDPKPEPMTGGLVEAMKEALYPAYPGAGSLAPLAIKVVADWLQSRNLGYTANVLRGELDKGNRGPTFQP